MHNSDSAQLSFEHLGLRCLLCGSYDTCDCAKTHDVRYHPDAERPSLEHWAAFIHRIMLNDHEIDLKKLIFVTLTFGCTKCACITGAYCHLTNYEQDKLTDEQAVYASKWTTCGEDYHEYLTPSYQAGRKRFTRFFEDDFPSVLRVKKVYGAEERGTYYGRLHYHALVLCDVDVPSTALKVLDLLWPHGFSDWNTVENVDHSIQYIAKYTAKTHVKGSPSPFFFFKFEPDQAELLASEVMKQHQPSLVEILQQLEASPNRRSSSWLEKFQQDNWWTKHDM